MPNPANAPAGFLPTANWQKLRLRAELLRRLREFFHRHGFLEVETPIVWAYRVVYVHLDRCAVVLGLWPTGPPRGRVYWLHTSPVFAMKRLLAAGGRAIYQVTRAFRRDEQGPLHNPEFTMVEWYRVDEGMSEGIELLSDLCQELLARGRAEPISYRRAFEQFAGLNPQTASSEQIAKAVRAAGVEPPASLAPEDRDGWLDLLLVECVQPHLGRQRPAILYDFPASQAALARVRPEDPPLAERFELYVSGIELANGYHELLEASVLRVRNAANNALRVADGKSPLPEESRLLAAMEAGLPDATGVALGFDRLVMLAAGAARLDEVIAFPFDRA